MTFCKNKNIKKQESGKAVCSKKITNIKSTVFPELILKNLSEYSLEKYIKDVEKMGLEAVWNNICHFVIANSSEKVPEILDIKNLGELYEIGLAIIDKQQKKDSGKYYTPDDIAKVMSCWLNICKGDIVCDVGCGTGNLILTYLDTIGFENAYKLISSGKLYLYDSDKVALSVCKTILSVKYGLEISDKINCIFCDFLDNSVILPKGCKVISNPPYAKITKIQTSWDNINIIKDTKEYYAAFMGKILEQSQSAVIISPFSFISGAKFYSLRKIMNKNSGFVIAFDNVPGNIFYGRKHGIFNTNKTNSVRAAITVSEKNKKQKGFRITPLIRFKQTERKKLLKCNVLEGFLNPSFQTVTEKKPMFFKCHKDLSDIFDIWQKKSRRKTLSDYLVKDGKYILSMPNTCRYYTTASASFMNRSGQIILSFDNKKVFNFIFCLINSSFAYWYWRIYDGGITYNKNLLLSMPVFYELLSENDHKFFEKFSKEIIQKSNKYIVKKNNIGTQENIKYPKKYRDEINSKLLEILNINNNSSVFDVIHSNMALKININL